jgi:hypothetical protein
MRLAITVKLLSEDHSFWSASESSFTPEDLRGRTLRVTSVSVGGS